MILSLPGRQCRLENAHGIDPGAKTGEESECNLAVFLGVQGSHCSRGLVAVRGRRWQPPVSLFRQIFPTIFHFPGLANQLEHCLRDHGDWFEDFQPETDRATAFAVAVLAGFAMESLCAKNAKNAYRRMLKPQLGCPPASLLDVSFALHAPCECDTF